MKIRYRSPWIDCGEIGFYPLAVVQGGLMNWQSSGGEGPLAIIDAEVTETQRLLLLTVPGVEVI